MSVKTIEKDFIDKVPQRYSFQQMAKTVSSFLRLSLSMPTKPSLIAGEVLRRTHPDDSYCEAIRALGVDSCDLHS